MAEEKIKSAEVLSDEALDNVAGGTFDETMRLYNGIAEVNEEMAAKISRDSRNYQQQGYSPEKAMGNAMHDALLTHGIYSSFEEDEANRYKLVGKSGYLSEADVLNILSFEM